MAERSFTLKPMTELEKDECIADLLNVASTLYMELHAAGLKSSLEQEEIENG